MVIEAANTGALKGYATDVGHYILAKESDVCTHIYVVVYA